MVEHQQDRNTPLSMLREIAATITPEQARLEQDRLRQRAAEIEAAYQRDLDEVRREIIVWDQLMPFIGGSTTVARAGSQPTPRDDPREDTTTTSGRDASPPTASEAPNLGELILAIAREYPAQEYWRGKDFTKIITERGLLGDRTPSAINMTLKRLEKRNQVERMEDGTYRFDTLSPGDRERIAAMQEFQIASVSALPSSDQTTLGG